MLKSLAILAVMFVFAHAPADAPRKGGGQQDHANHDAGKSDQATPPISQPPTEFRPIFQPPKWEPKSDPTQQKPGYWEEARGPANAANWALVGIGGIAGFLAWRTIRAIQKQADAQMSADRAWVLANAIGNPRTPLYNPADPGYTPGIVYLIEIAGNTPARIIRERFRCRIVPAIKGVPQLEPSPVYESEKGMFNGSAIYPSGHKYQVSISLESGPLTEDEFKDLQDGATSLCAYACIDYLDTFGRKAMTQVCAVYNFALGGVFTSPDGTVLNPPGFRLGGPEAYNQYT